MAEAVSDSNVLAVKPPPKRRRILDPSAIIPVPVYSNKVSSSLQLRPAAALFTDSGNTDGGVDDSLLSEFSCRQPKASLVTLSDSEDEAEHEQIGPEHKQLYTDRCPSPPPPPESPVHKQSRKVKQKISEIDRRIQAVNSLLSPEPQDRTSRRRRHLPSPPPDDDVIILTADSESQSSEYTSSVREIPLKVRCRTDIHKIPVLSSTPLSVVVTQMSVILNVPPSRLLLLKEEVELPTDATLGELGLGIADIIECVVMAAEDESEGDSSKVITVRLQSKDRDSSQEISLHRDAPLGSIFSQYLSKMSTGAQMKVRFHFDGCRVTGSQTPAQLDMEDGDIIEVWT